jgi:transposase
MVKPLTRDQKTLLMLLHARGETLAAVAKTVKCSIRTVYNVLKRWADEQKTATRPRLGRPKCLTAREARKIVRMVKSGDVTSCMEVRR